MNITSKKKSERNTLRVLHKYQYLKPLSRNSLHLKEHRRGKLHRFATGLGLRRWIIILLVLTLLIIGIYQVSLSSPQVAPSTKIVPDTVVLSFAGVSVTAGQIDAAELHRAQTLVQEALYNGNASQKRRIEDYAFYTLFNIIETNKQLKLHALSNSDDLMKQIIPLQKVAPQTALQFYKTHLALFARSAPQIHTREIMVNDKTLATNLLRQLRAGASFFQLAQQYSVDPQQYRDQGGDLGWITKEQMPWEWDNVAFSLPQGQISEVFQVGKLYCILQVIEGPEYDVIPYKELSPPGPIIAAQYFQQQRFHEWLSIQILNEPLIIFKPSYSQAVQNAISDLRVHPDQELSER